MNSCDKFSFLSICTVVLDGIEEKYSFKELYSSKITFTVFLSALFYHGIILVVIILLT